MDPEEFLVREYDHSCAKLQTLDNILAISFWLYISLIVIFLSVAGIMIGLDVSGTNLLIFISFCSLVLLLIGIAMLQLSLHITDKQILLGAYVQEIVFHFMGKGLKPVHGVPRNQEVARILDFKYVFDRSHRDDWHLRRRDHILSCASPDHKADSWCTDLPIAERVMSFLLVFLSGLVAFSTAGLMSAFILSKAGSLEITQRGGQYLYFGIVLGMEMFVSSWIFFNYVLKNRIKARRERADEAFRRKKNEWFSLGQDLRNVGELASSAASWRKEASGEETS